MAVPMAILDAARLGDRETVVAWLDSPGANVNAVAHDGVSLLMVVGCRYGPDGPPPRDAETSLELARELLRRGADVNLELVRPSSIKLRAFEISLSCLDTAFVSDDAAPEFVRDFAYLLIDAGSQVSELCVFTLLQMFVNGQSSRCLAEIFFKLLRAGAPMDTVSLFPTYFQTTQASTPALAQDEHWSACRALAEGVEAAGGSWAGYRRMPRKEVLRLRSLVLRGRAPPHSTSHSTRGDDPVVARVLLLPDQLAWKVLGFWRATSDITGEVI